MPTCCEISATQMPQEAMVWQESAIVLRKTGKGVVQ